MDNTSIEIMEPMQAMDAGDRSTGILDTSTDNIMYLAEKADKMITAMNKIMSAALKITSEQINNFAMATAGSKRIFQLLSEEEEVDNGYVTLVKGKENNGQFIECEGSRSMKDDFFGGKPDARKPVDEISERNVRQAAYTNCINNGIKRIIPGLRGIDARTLEEAGIDTGKIKGYTFKDGGKGGASKAADSGLKCEKCGASISQKVASYSQSRYDGHMYCMDCQKVASAGGGTNDSTGN